MYPSSLEKLIELFRSLPSVGRKTAERYAMAVLEMPEENVEAFSKQMMDVLRKIRKCPVCGNITESEKCEICSDENRDHTVICVVQQPRDVMALERLGQFKGVYHVLHGAISTVKGVLPEDINIESLFSRIDDNTKEIIIATNSTLEGDTTALYLTKRLRSYENITVTRLASGLPSGGNLDYADDVTLMRAFQGRIRQ
ncbi:MAG: recombination protein RecR [Erysipelotrichaceae bacterium]|jgi:recombination protein RecR|nr:recombination protein RecR [Erysipelotrichaceae bacterium]MBQ1303292.1 recombination protein RecR [Erysipelotrichaceae bacterium]MBQ1757897.1 recombination protein RecR [Erysipelotrichaceae bacterium]MBR2792853.1 recombination protein RecR [Erysipelotrichaceae bacterium]MBR3350817.1 recombination protein RecR [Erysipelotrichaceae bacterium]